MTFTKRTSYICKTHPGLKGHAQFVADTADAIQFKYALVESPQVPIGHLIQTRDNTFTHGNQHFAPIPCHTWRKMGGVKTMRALEAEGVISVQNHSNTGDGNGKCRAFRITDKWYNEYQAAGLATVDDFRTYNILTNKVTKMQLKTHLYDENGHPYFGNVRCQEALKILASSSCPVDKECAKTEIGYIMDEVRYSRVDSDHRRLSTALKSVARVLTSAGSREVYQPAYRVTFSGRMTEIGSGLQGAPQRVKYAAFGSMIARGEAFNYDMSAAQARVLLKLLNAYNKKQVYLLRMGSKNAQPVIKVEMLEKFCRDRVFRDRVFADMAMAGCPEEHTKQVFYAVIMGMSTKEANYPDAPKGLSEYIDCPLKRKAVAEKLFWLTDLMKSANKMLDRMIAPNLQLWKINGGNNIKEVSHLMAFHRNLKGVYCRNGAGMFMQITDGNGKRLEGMHHGKIWAFVLQGAESRYICELICQCHENGIPVYSYQYDGLITGKEIPSEIKHLAAKESGLGNAAVLETKAFKRVIKLDNSHVDEGYVEELYEKYANASMDAFELSEEGISVTRREMIHKINRCDKIFRGKVIKEKKREKLHQGSVGIHGYARADYPDEGIRRDEDYAAECAWIRGLNIRLPYYSEAEVARAGSNYSETEWQQEKRRHLADLRAFAGSGSYV